MRDRSSIYLILALALMVIGGFAIFQYRHTKVNEPVAERSKAENTSETSEVKFIEKGKYPSFASGVMGPGNIRLELSPEGFDGTVFKVRYFANAHDMVLGPYDLATMTTLEYDGEHFTPMRVDRMKGHHDSGLLYFDLGKLHSADFLKTFSITVRGLPKEKTRVFKWQ